MRRRLVAPAGLLGGIPLLGLVTTVLLVPIAVFLSYSFRSSELFGVGDTYTLDSYREVVTSPEFRELMLRSAVVAVIVAGIVVLCAFVLAYAITFRFGRWGNALLGVVLVSSLAAYIVRIYAWSSILGSNGLVNATLQAVGITDQPVVALSYGYPAIVITMVYLYLPVAALIITANMSGIDRGQLEASADLGGGRWRTVASVVAPQTTRAVASAFALTAIIASADFVTPALVGGPKGQMVGTTIQSAVLSRGDYPLGAALGVATIVCTLATLGLVLAAARISASVAHRAAMAFRPAQRHRRRRIRTSLSAPVAGALIAFLVAPLVVVVVFSLNTNRSVGLPMRGLTLSWYPAVLDEAGLIDSMANSLKLAVLTMLAALAIGVPAAFSLVRAQGWFRRVLWVAVLAPLVVPGVLIGAALLTAANDTGIRLGLGVTLAAQALYAVPFVALIVRARILSIDDRLTESGRDLGSTARRALRTVVFPLLLPSLAGGALLAASVALDEILISTFTLGGDSTLPVWILSRARRALTPGINAIAVMVLAVSLVSLVVATRIASRVISQRNSQAGTL